MLNKIMVQCSTAINKSSIYREMREGIEHIIVSSYTLPDDVVMNGILYPSTEINKSYKTLERTLAPVEHPTNNEGKAISANDPDSIHNYYAGAYNENVKKVGNRIHLDKVINVSEAVKTDRGKRLLDRISELENSETPRPIHTSTGVFLTVEELEFAERNGKGQEYKMIASEMVFDHDAILLDSIGAATPEQGVGMAVNSDGSEIDIHHLELNDEEINSPEESKSYSDKEIEELLFKALNKSPLKADYIKEVSEKSVTYFFNKELFTVPYSINTGSVATVGTPLLVDSNVQSIPKTNSEGDEMKDLILNALKEAGIEIADNATEDQILEAYNGLHSNSDTSDDEGADSEGKLADVVANALKPVTDELAELKAKIGAKQDDEISTMAELVGNSATYPGLDAETAKLLPIEKLKEFASNCGQSYGVSPVVNADDDVVVLAPVDMPE